MKFCYCVLKIVSMVALFTSIMNNSFWVLGTVKT